jgi:hypothetical protein
MKVAGLVRGSVDREASSSIAHYFIDDVVVVVVSRYLATQTDFIDGTGSSMARARNIRPFHRGTV